MKNIMLVALFLFFSQLSLATGEGVESVHAPIPGTCDAHCAFKCGRYSDKIYQFYVDAAGSTEKKCKSALYSECFFHGPLSDGCHSHELHGFVYED